MIKEDDTRERALWKAVIVQALRDATSTVLRSKNNTRALTVSQQSHARAWFISNDQDFRDVCELAGINPRIVRRTAASLKLREWSRDIFKNNLLTDKMETV